MARAHVAHKDGKFAGVIGAALNADDPTRHVDPKAAAKWKKDVAAFCGDFIADGFMITTVDSREEYNALIDNMPMWEAGHDAN